MPLIVESGSTQDRGYDTGNRPSQSSGSNRSSISDHVSIEGLDGAEELLEISRKVVLNIFEWMGRLLIEETFHCGNGRKSAETVSETSDLVSCWSKTQASGIRPHVGAGLSQGMRSLHV